MSPPRRWRAPGRVNLIGGHVDYHDGVVVAMAIDRSVDATVDATEAASVRVRSDAFDGIVSVPADGSAEPSSVTPAWGRLVAGVVAELAGLGVRTRGLDVSLAADLPVAGGLSSSAAVEVVLAAAIAGDADRRLDRMEMAAAAQRAEHRATGVPCGIQDQVAVVWGGVVALDVADGAVTPTSLPTGCAVLVVDSGVARTLEGSPWTARRAETLATAARLGRDVLRGVPPEAVAEDPRARHVVSEIERAERFVRALDADDPVAAGSLMVESHRSSRDDFGSSIAELDLLVDRLMAEGAYGARLTGGGFGGCVVALVSRPAAAGIADRVVAHAVAATGRDVRAHLVSPAPGVRALT